MVCCCGFFLEQRAHAKHPRKRPCRPGMLQSSKDRAKALGLVFVKEFLFGSAAAPSAWAGCTRQVEILCSRRAAILARLCAAGGRVRPLRAGSRTRRGRPVLLRIAAWTISWPRRPRETRKSSAALVAAPAS